MKRRVVTTMALACGLAVGAVGWAPQAAAQSNAVPSRAAAGSPFTSSSRVTSLEPTATGPQTCTAAGFARARLNAQVRGARARVDDDRRLPLVVEADAIEGSPEREVTAQGSVRAEQGATTFVTDWLRYDHTSGTALARGDVRVDRLGDRFTTRELQLQVERFEGYALDTSYFFSLANAGGRAERIEFLGSERSTLTGADYTSCPREEGQRPAWLLRSDRVELDFANNEGRATGAVLEFMGVPILAAPVLRFPLTDERKSGWLPPSINFDNKKGLDVTVPYYWNIAPHLDATLAPTIYTRRGVALGSEFRYLGASHSGEARTDLLPRDRVADRSRFAAQWMHRDTNWYGFRLGAELERASDDAYWKDFPGHIDTLTRRLLTQDLHAARPLNLGPLEGTAYARVLRWQVLQDEDPLALIVAPYQRSPQVGWRAQTPWHALGADVTVETEVNRFTRPERGAATALPEGSRAHLLAGISRRWGTPGWWIEPGFKLNAAAYATDAPMSDGSRRAQRIIPTGSVDAGLVYERDSTWFGRDVRQTLEPRLRYVNTPFRNQTRLPNFDAAGNDFNLVSIFGDNAFSGVDRVSDAHQITVGATSRWLDADTGIERLRAGAVQRYLLRDQRITPDGQPITQRLSDVLFFGNSTVSDQWTLGGAVQYNAESSRISRSVLSARYSPGPFRTLGVGYRFVRGASEQIDIGWQWPLYGQALQMDEAVNGGARASGPTFGNRACRGTLYSVGRINYSKRDSRVTDSLIGFEYDAGCWIGRLVVERLSTGRTEATTRPMLQIEFVGLSRLGSNPLQALKDNIPDYRLLRDDARPIAPPPVYD